MTKFLAKAAVLAIIPVLCAGIVVNAYLVSKNLKRIEEDTAQRLQASQTQAEISSLAVDLQAMETSQRGYLLTGEESYLKPYGEANGRLAARFTALRPRLTGNDRSVEEQLESVISGKTDEMNQTIRLRQQGYRHRAFVIVGSNRGQQLMVEAGKLLDELSSSQSNAAVHYDRERAASVGQAFRQSILANAVLLLVAILAFFGFNGYRSRLESAHARQGEELRATRLQLQRVTAAVFRDFRALLAELQTHAAVLLNAYGGFLPRQAHEKVQRIDAATAQMISDLDGLSSDLLPAPSAKPAATPEVRPAQPLSA